jgi:hypothetical protein
MPLKSAASPCSLASTSKGSSIGNPSCFSTCLVASDWHLHLDKMKMLVLCYCGPNFMTSKLIDLYSLVDWLDPLVVLTTNNCIQWYNLICKILLNEWVFQERVEGSFHSKSRKKHSQFFLVV